MFRVTKILLYFSYFVLLFLFISLENPATCEENVNGRGVIYYDSQVSEFTEIETTTGSSKESSDTKDSQEKNTNDPNSEKEKIKVLKQKSKLTQSDEDLFEFMVRIANSPAEWEKIRQVLSRIRKEENVDSNAMEKKELKVISRKISKAKSLLSSSTHLNKAQTSATTTTTLPTTKIVENNNNDNNNDNNNNNNIKQRILVNAKKDNYISDEIIRKPKNNINNWPSEKWIQQAVENSRKNDDIFYNTADDYEEIYDNSMNYENDYDEKSDKLQRNSNIKDDYNRKEGEKENLFGQFISTKYDDNMNSDSLVDSSKKDSTEQVDEYIAFSSRPSRTRHSRKRNWREDEGK